MYLDKKWTFPNYEKKNIIYFSRTPLFSLQKNSLKMLNFEIFLPLKKPLVAIFTKECALTSKKYVSKSDVSILNLLDKLIFFVALLRFCFRKVA